MSPILSLSTNQRDFYIDQMMWPEGSHWNIGAVVKTAGPLDIECCRFSLNLVIRNNAALRTRIYEYEGKPLQTIAPPQDEKFPLVDFSNYGDSQERAEQYIKKDFSKPFNFGQNSLLFTLKIIRISNEEHIFYAKYHHTITDGWGTSIFFREAISIYNLIKNNVFDEAKKRENDFYLIKYLQDESEYLQSKLFTSDSNYWSQRLGGFSPRIFPEIAPMKLQGIRREIYIPRDKYDRVNAFCQQMRSSVFHFIISVLLIYLSERYDKNDLTVGVSLLNRNKKEYKEAIGLFVSMLPFRVQLNGDETLSELIDKVCSLLRQDYRHQRLPIGEMKRIPALNCSSNEYLYDIILSYEKHDYSETLCNTQTTCTPLYSGEQKLPLIIYVREFDQTKDVKIDFDFNLSYLDSATIDEMVSHFQKFFDAALEPFDKSILSFAETNIPETELSDMKKLEESQTLVSAFENIARTYSHRQAVQFENVTLTYAELDARANRLAHYLRNAGVKPETRVGLCLERSENMVIAILAVLKAGGTYVPLDPKYPSSRLQFILKDSEIYLLLAEESILAQLSDEKVKAFTLELIEDEVAKQPDTPLQISLHPAIPAYIIYTSGSTGTPKGCVVTHANVIHLMGSTESWYGFNEEDVWTVFHSFAFDFSVWELWGALLYGGKAIIVPFWLSRSPEAFRNFLATEKVTVLNQTPSAFYQLIHADEASGSKLALRYVIFGGEALNLQTLLPWLERYGDKLPSLVNMYGITETTVHVTYRPISISDVTEESGSLIGETIPNLNIYLLNEQLELVAEGEPGEIYVAGAGVTSGYLNRPALTAERFLPNPFGNGRIYRSGDLGRRLSNGDIEYLCRIDEQVKIRGFRIELGEIQAALTSHPQVREAFVTIYENEDSGDKRLVAYYVAGEPNPTANELRQHLASRVPDYMVASAYINLDAFPLTDHGKINAKVLRSPDWNLLRVEEQYVAPSDAWEEILCAIVAQVLGLERVGIDDNLFEIGCDSILALQIVAAARKEGISLAMRNIYETPTIRELAADKESIVPAVLTDSPAFNLISEEDSKRLPEDAEDAYPLSNLQSGILYHKELHPDSAIYHAIFSFELRLPYLEEAWRKALADICRIHPTLRTSFHWTGYSQPLQIVHREIELPLAVYDVRDLGAKADYKVKEWIESEKARPFDGQLAPLFRLTIHRLSDDQVSLSFTCHHVIVDGWSVATLMTQLLRRYLEHFEGLPTKQLIASANTYKDFIIQEQNAIASEEMRQFWENRLDGLEVSTLPRIKQVASEDKSAHKVERLEIPIDNEVTNNLRAVAKSVGVPLKTALLAAHLRVLSFLTGQNNVVTGNISNARPEINDGENLLGLFVNTIPFGMELHPSSWLDLVQAVFRAENEIIPYRQFPLLEMQRLTQKRPLFEVGFHYDHFHIYEGILDLPQIEFLNLYHSEELDFPFVAKFSLIPGSSSLELKLLYDAKQFDSSQVEQYGKYYQTALSSLANNPLAPFHSQSLMSDEEQKNWLLVANVDNESYISQESLVSAFTKAAAQYSQKAALSFQDVTLNYAELEAKSNCLAHYLQSKGVGTETLVGLCLNRSEELVVSILAILKAGGAYVPIDPSYPSERIDFLLGDSGISLLVTQKEALSQISSCQTEIVVLEDIASELNLHSQQPVAVTILPDHPAYVIYTSGSTGTPKGCIVTHANVIRLLKATQGWFEFNSEDVWTMFHSYAFDFSVWEIWGALLYGGRVAVVPYWTSRSPQDFLQLIQSEKVSVLNQTPSAFKQLVQADEGEPKQLALRYVIFGGESLELQNLQPWFHRYGDQKPQLVNMYGITETTVHVTYRPISQADISLNRGSVIGQPIPDVKLYILDEYLEPLPIGVSGELYVGGAGVTRGYLHHPRLSAQRFIPDVFAKTPGSRLYRSGDLARRLPDGEVEYLGRSDHQVKIRGFRIELGEIETVLASHPQVKAAFATVRTEFDGNTRIVGYFVSDEKEDLVIFLRDFLQARLPDYMLPAAFVPIDTIPLTVHGKVDSAALPAPDWTRAIQPYVAPRNNIEANVCSFMADILGLERVGVMDDFFDIGGDSISVTQLVTRLREIYKTELSLPEVFYNGTPEALARLITASQPDETTTNIPRSSRNRRTVNLSNDGSLIAK